jgi:hypothetical protein
VHGIYAADSRQLSVRAAFPSLWDAEKRGNGSVVRGMLRNMISSSILPAARHELGPIKERMQGASVFSFQDGLEEITQALLVHLDHRPNVELFTGTRLQSLDIDPASGDFKVSISRWSRSCQSYDSSSSCSTIRLGFPTSQSHISSPPCRYQTSNASWKTLRCHCLYLSQGRRQSPSSTLSSHPAHNHCTLLGSDISSPGLCTITKLLQMGYLA